VCVHKGSLTAFGFESAGPGASSQHAMSTSLKAGPNTYQLLHRLCLLIAHTFANVTVFILVYYSCRRYPGCPRTLRPLSITAEIEPFNLVFSMGMGTSALFTCVLVVSLYRSVSLFLRLKTPRMDKNHFSPRGKQIFHILSCLTCLGVVSYLALFVVTITHAQKQTALHSGFGLIHFFSSWSFSFGIQWVRFAMIDTYGQNDLEGPKQSKARFRKGQWFLLFLLVADLAFGTVWFVVNLVPHVRHHFQGLESVLEVTAVLIQINYCCMYVFDHAGRCGTSLSGFYNVVPDQDRAECSDDEVSEPFDDSGEPSSDKDNEYTLCQIVNMVWQGIWPGFYLY
jgi:hypothetical protein